MRSSSCTSVIEMEPVRLAPSSKSTKIASSPLPQELLRNDELAAAAAVEDDELPPPSTASSIVQRWNYPRSNMPKVAACFWSFIVIGANDAAYGALIHYIEQYYNLTYLIVSLIFLSPFVGYTASAFMNNWIHHNFGQRGVAFTAPVCHLIAYLIIALHPPYPVLVIAFTIAGYGNGLADAAWNAWIGNMDHANEILGFLHGLYGLGAVISPLAATSMVTKANLPWYTFYYLMLSLAGLELVTSMVAFWKSTASAYRSSMSHSGETQKGSLRNALTRRPSARVTWLCALFLLGYVGIEVALGGWIVVFMIQVRHGEEFASGMTATGFWLGIAIGRVILAFVTPRIGEKMAITIYLPMVMGLELLFWLVPQFTVSAVAVSLQGFFLGPLFPAAIVAMSKLLPRHLHVGAIGFAAAFGSSGAAILPFAVGAIAQAKGVQVLQPIILALLAAIFVLWLGLPKFGGKKKE
ncbi:putative Major facilitator superfamily domain-containing protein [Seiridium cardinale]|uniref:Major facilitator superfamily domain-containing protein n=1 Tax=Seiridium cardinale TaxID=138064 RepID=A0ABR2Y206_9PEZI